MNILSYAKVTDYNCTKLIKSGKKQDFIISKLQIITESRLQKEKTTTLIITHKGSLGVASVEDGKIINCVVLHTDESTRYAIDVERLIFNSSNLNDDKVKLINLNELVSKIIPNKCYEVQLDLNVELNGINCFIRRGGLNVTINASPTSFGKGLIKESLSSFIQDISKIYNIMQDYNSIQTINSYLQILTSKFNKTFNNHSKTQFLALVSFISNFKSNFNFDEYHFDHISENNIEEYILNTTKFNTILELITDITNKKINEQYNFKTLKLYFNTSGLQVYLLGSKIDKLYPNLIMYILRHMQLGNIIDDFKSRLERTKLLNA